MKIAGFTKTSLLDYPHHLSCVLFTPGCNYRCPFCHNGLIVTNHNIDLFDTDKIMDYLKKRKNVLEGVCITGGEPTLQNDLLPFILSIKDLGYKIKLDTNGSHPKIIKSLLNNNLLDYIAMDIKSSLSHYPKTCGTPRLDVHTIEESINIITKSSIEYEFRTTAVNGLHSIEDFTSIGKMLKNRQIPAYYLQNFRYADGIIHDMNFSSFTLNDMEIFKSELNKYIKNVSIRGIE